MGGGGKDDGGVHVTWLGSRELRVLEAWADTLLPGFDVDDKEAADAIAEQMVAMVRANLFRKEVGPRERGNTTSGRGGRGGGGVLAWKRPNVNNCSQEQLPVKVEAYTRTLVRRCLAMYGRSGSDVGVAVLLAQAFEINISEEERSGLRVLFRVLSTRLGAFVLTGRAVPFQSQSLAARHGVLKRWSVSRIRPLRDAFQGVKRLTCSLFFSAHPEVHHKPSHPEGSGAESTAALAKIKTNPNWIDIRYDPQHHRFARDETPAVSSAGQRPDPIAAAAVRPGLWSGAKVKDRVSQTARAAAAVASTAPRPSTSLSANSHSNPPSPASSLPPSFSATAAAAPPSRVPAPEDVPPKFFSRPRSKSSGSAAATAGAFLPSSGTTSGSASAAPTSPHETLPQQLTVDVVVVGSGAGGGCAAGALAARGLRVAVLEKGGLYGAHDFARFSEMEAYKDMYEGQGVLATEGGAVVILAGSCVGGGTTVNWAASFRTPRHVRLEWSRKLGLKSFEPGGPFDDALDAVCSRLGVNIGNSHRAPGFPVPNASLRVNQHQSSLWNGAAASGRVPRAVPTNTKDCVDCGSCLHGCAYGSKQSTHVTWLQDGLDSGNIILVPHAKVERVLMDAGRATGVEAVVSPHGGGMAASLTVRARAVVVSGGAINTPAILLRSGLKHPMIGRHLCLHPVLAVGGVFPEDYDGEHGAGEDDPKRSTGGSMAAAAGTAGKQAKSKASASAKQKLEAEVGSGEGTNGSCPRVPGVGRGVMMGVYVQDLMRLDGGYGCVIEAPPSHPGLMGLVMPWNDALTHRYALGEEDSQVILQGRSEMLRMMRKAGASLLIPAHEGAPWFCPTDGKEGDEDLEGYVEAMESLGTTLNEAGLYSAHQMGSCRLSANPEDGPLRESGESWECDGLFVADASVFPTSLGINPMITVEAVAYMIADQVATRLGKDSEDSKPRGESSPLKRRIKTFGKAMVAAISRESSSTSDADNAGSSLTALRRSNSRGGSNRKLVPEEGGRGSDQTIIRVPGGAAAAERCVLPQSTLAVSAGGDAAAGMGDDFGVEVTDLYW
ncbi:oxidoreductase [Ectocarpus siliculosus]|uniref:Oxidoreductase n=1 Tax=Ectocarpus siliculosus TaxID=2880 RepID=D7G5T1_ECTSI|nr:oxidoreductase [Ectocarpus siliculosus]|eukprot:CBJ27378.1 oxidoreductase [Ectocarpus siliculosus]